MVSSQEDLQLLFKISPEAENTAAVSTTKSRLPQFGNSLQCESSGHKLPAKVVKTKLN